TSWPRDWSSDVCSSDLEVEELVLQPAEDVVELAHLRRARRRPVHGAHDADRGVELVDRAVRIDACAVLRDARAADEVRLAAVARSEERRVGKEWWTRPA